MRAADALMESLKAEGVEHVFGIPGGANLPTYDALVDADFRHIQVRHEQGGGHAAEGYAKASGKVGVAFATSGPGATNLVTAIADAMLDSVPTVFITGQVRTELIGTDGFQEADILGATLPFVKHSFAVTDPRQIPEYVHEAFHVASTGRPGPVLLDIPQDLSRADIEYAPRTEPVELAGYKPPTAPNIKQVRIAAKAIANARRPILYTGGGVINANASEELRELVASDRFPITSTLMGLGAYPASGENWLGMLGMHGTRAANYAMDEADLIVAIGARFDDRITGKLAEFAPHAKFVHIDVDPAEISKNVPADPAAHGQRLEIGRPVRSADELEDDVERPGLDELVRRDRVDAERRHLLTAVLVSHRRGDPRAGHRPELHGGRADASGGAVHEQPLADAQARLGQEGVVGGEEDLRRPAGGDPVEPSGTGIATALVDHRKLGLAAAGHDRHHAVALLEAQDAVAGGDHLAGQLEPRDVLRGAGRGRIAARELHHVGAVEPRRRARGRATRRSAEWGLDALRRRSGRRGSSRLASPGDATPSPTPPRSEVAKRPLEGVIRVNARPAPMARVPPRVRGGPAPAQPDLARRRGGARRRPSGSC